MRWKGGRKSSNIDDRRGSGGSFKRGLPFGKKSSFSLTTIAVLFLGYWILGGDPIKFLNFISNVNQGSPSVKVDNSYQKPSKENKEVAEFVSVILADTEDVWSEIFRKNGSQYREPTLVLFSGSINSACGFASSASGPFYCPGDSKLYLDLSFLNELKKLGAKGDFPLAYVIAHEVAHHIQNLTGTLTKVARAKQDMSKNEANQLQVKVELQADCYSGVWANHAENQRDLLEAGDIEEGINAAAAIGDDNLMKRAGRSVSPESFTHGSSKQRVDAFVKGYKTGLYRECGFIS
ncbi:UNVERIFIED_CONTAM: hypothetical protein GTU68_058673 [Idotea baltica]|nr:hypothetical protein [Idotea baltica]